MLRRNHARHRRNLIILGLSSIAIAFSQLASASAIILADSAATDRAARRIRTHVANDGLKPITTKEETAQEAGTNVLFVKGAAGGEGESLVVETGETLPIPARPVISTEQAPGVRQPANHAGSKSGSNSAGNFEAKIVKPLEPKSSSKLPSADQAQKFLENGNRRYVNQSFRKDGRLPADRAKSSATDAPHAIVLSCSDSRVPPEVIFDQGVGEISVIRTMGTTLDSAVIASLEHIVQKSDTSLLVVLGHTSCSAIETAMTLDPNASAGSAALDQAIADIRPRIGNLRLPAHEHKTPSKGFEIEASTNAQAVAADLMKQSEILRERVKAGALRITPALYNIESGIVKFY
jgi:carbonic anhydrase